MQQRALNTKEASKYIGRSVSFLTHGRVNGDLPGRTSTPPFIKQGRNIVYLIEDLDNWLESFPKVHHLAELDTLEAGVA